MQSVFPYYLSISYDYVKTNEIRSLKQLFTPFFLLIGKKKFFPK